eukprot:scaffold3380_cov44-Phaeocystis_antarctica.AAC.1
MRKTPVKYLRPSECRRSELGFISAAAACAHHAGRVGHAGRDGAAGPPRLLERLPARRHWSGTR